MPIANRLIVELTPLSLQLAVFADKRVVACADFPVDAKDAVAAFLAQHAVKDAAAALVASKQDFAAVSGAEQAAHMRSADDLQGFAAATAAGLPPPLASVACDAATGKPVDPAGKEPWLLAGTTAEALIAAKNQLAGLGIGAPARTGMALVAQLGAVAAALQDMPESTRVAVLSPGESTSLLALVTSGGVEAIKSVPFGYVRIFESVQAELGLKFRAAALKLFFNPSYDFTEAGPKIAARLAEALRPEVGALGSATAFQFLGLPAAQGWLPAGIAQALALESWAPEVGAVAAQLGLEPGENTLSANALGLARVAISGAPIAWSPAWLGTEEAKPAAAPVAAKPVVKPAAPVAPVVATKPVVPAPAAIKPAPAAKPAPAVVVAPLKPAAPVRATQPVVQKPVAPAKPPAVKVPEPVAAAPEEVDASRQPAKKSPLPLIVGGAAAVVALAVIGFVFAGKSKPSPSAPAAAVAPAGPTAAELAALNAEVARDPSGFRCDAYRFSVTDKGVLENLAIGSQTTPLVKDLGFVRLYEVVTSADGRKSARRVGDMNSPDYRASVVKKVRDGAVVFDVEVQHPRFSLRQTFTCLPHSVKVHCEFTPQASSAPVDAVYGIYFDEGSLVSPRDRPVQGAGAVTYDARAGSVAVRYGSSFKGAVEADPALLSFVLSTAANPAPSTFDYEIALP